MWGVLGQFAPETNERVDCWRRTIPIKIVRAAQDAAMSALAPKAFWSRERVALLAAGS